MAWIVIHETRKTVYYGPFAYYTEAMDFRNKKRSLYANDGLEVDLRIEATIEIASVARPQAELAAENAMWRSNYESSADLAALTKYAREHPTATERANLQFQPSATDRQAEIDAAAEAAIKGSPDAFRG